MKQQTDDWLLRGQYYSPHNSVKDIIAHDNRKVHSCIQSSVPSEHGWTTKTTMCSPTDSEHPFRLNVAGPLKQQSVLQLIQSIRSV